MIKRAWVVLAVCLSLFFGAKVASAASGVVFVHGTSDHTQASATSGYWTQGSIDTMRNGRAYLVVGYTGASYAGYDVGAWGPVVDQIASWANGNGITQIAVVTHSNGIAPIRYMLAHGTAKSNAGNSVSSVTSRFISVTSVAGDMAGTPLADQVTTSGTLLNIANGIVSFFGGGSYANAAVWAQRQDRMATYNSNGTYGGSPGATAVGGVPVYTVAGTGVNANIFSGEAWCGGYLTTVGLYAARCLGWGCGGCTDGFIGCNSSMYLGKNISQDGKLNHNQSRRSCNNSGSTINNIVVSTLQAATAPPDTAVSAGAQACDLLYQGYFAGSSGETWYSDGCPSNYLSDGQSHFDCLVSYGSSGGLTAVTNYAQTAYSNANYYYSNNYAACPDSWQGDGVCDVCLLAKYGHDAAPGSASSADDCVNKGAGTTNVCADITYRADYGFWDYVGYHVSH